MPKKAFLKTLILTMMVLAPNILIGTVTQLNIQPALALASEENTEQTVFTIIVQGKGTTDLKVFEIALDNMGLTGEAISAILNAKSLTMYYGNGSWCRVVCCYYYYYSEMYNTHNWIHLDEATAKNTEIALGMISVFLSGVCLLFKGIPLALKLAAVFTDIITVDYAAIYETDKNPDGSIDFRFDFYPSIMSYWGFTFISTPKHTWIVTIFGAYIWSQSWSGWDIPAMGHGPAFMR